jgi:hypothetical protein
MTQVEEIIKTKGAHPEEQCSHMNALLTRYLTDRGVGDETLVRQEEELVMRPWLDKKRNWMKNKM